jgi:hypothetical protein
VADDEAAVESQGHTVIEVPSEGVRAEPFDAVELDIGSWWLP